MISFQRVTFDGKGRQYVYKNYPNPMGVAVYQSKVYWVDRNLRSIFRADKNPTNDTKVESMRADMDTLRDIVIFDEKNQPSGKIFSTVLVISKFYISD